MMPKRLTTASALPAADDGGLDPDIVPPETGAAANTPLPPARVKGLTIRDYLLEARRIIQETVPAQSRFNVSDLPDGRTLRYYQTLGLVDRPARHNGRSVYLQRHLLQLVAVKLLQADQYTLAKIQQLLTEADDKGLREIIRRHTGVLDSLLEPAGDEPVTADTGAAGDLDPVASPLLRRFALEHGVEITIEDGKRFSRQRCMELARKLHELLLKSSGWTALDALPSKAAGEEDEEDEEEEPGPREHRA